MVLREGEMVLREGEMALGENWGDLTWENDRQSTIRGEILHGKRSERGEIVLHVTNGEI